MPIRPLSGPPAGGGPCYSTAVSRWIFGYGSLVWRPAFPFLESAPARLDGFARRFWQGSADHRGVPEAPGRVVTLVPDETAHVVGVAYRVSAEVRSGVLVQLDHREQGGYLRHEVELSLRGRETRSVFAVIYVAAPDNPSWLGPAPLDAMVEQIRDSRGPSGRNDEYLLRLDAWLRDVGVDDPHVRELADRLRELA